MPRHPSSQLWLACALAGAAACSNSDTVRAPLSTAIDVSFADAGTAVEVSGSEDALGVCADPDSADLDGDGLCDAADPDADGDGVPRDEDCNDTDPGISPFSGEICDGVDNDCDQVVDEGYADTDSDGLADCVDPDDDNDGDPDDSDCAPEDPSVWHGATEQCDGVDQSCDGVIDEGCPAVGVFATFVGGSDGRVVVGAPWSTPTVSQGAWSLSLGGVWLAP